MTSLASKNTFGVDCNADEFFEISELQQLLDIIQTHDRESMFVLGGGSNILLADSAPHTILNMCNKGIEYFTQQETVFVKAMSGVVWHELVIDTLEHEYSGLENLALIPGLVGAAPIQNIGAYGVELEQRFESLTAVNLRTAEVKAFNRDQCQFDYRDSYFKTPEGRDFCIWDVTLRLDSKFQPVLGHQGLKHLEAQAQLDAQDVFNEVVNIRQSKLPDPEELGNAGSFFKNPVISNDHYQQLKTDESDIVAYQMSNDQWKIPAAWLIDRAGLKGYRKGAAGTHVKQALVMVNYGGASGKDLIALARFIQGQVMARFKILLEPEVNLVNETGLVSLEELE